MRMLTCRLWFRCVFGALFALLLGSVMAPTTAMAMVGSSCQRHPELEGTRETHVAQLNAFRTDQNRRGLEVNRSLNRIAQDYACTLARTGRFAHTGPEGSTLATRVTAGGYEYCLVAENLAKGQRSIGAALQAWARSPSHRGNLRLRGARETGLGIARAAPGVGGGPEREFRASVGGTAPASNAWVWVQLIARPC